MYTCARDDECVFIPLDLFEYVELKNNFLFCPVLNLINSCSIVDHVFFCIFNFVYKAMLYFFFSVKSMYRGEMPSYI